MTTRLCKVVEINVKTGKTKTVEREFVISDEPEIDVTGIDPEKLKQVLLNAGIIQDISEIELEIEPIKKPIT